MTLKLSLNAALGLKFIYYYYGIPTGTIAFWGTHVQHILTVDYAFKNTTAQTIGCQTYTIPEDRQSTNALIVFRIIKVEMLLLIWTGSPKNEAKLKHNQIYFNKEKLDTFISISTSVINKIINVLYCCVINYKCVICVRCEGMI